MNYDTDFPDFESLKAMYPCYAYAAVLSGKVARDPVPLTHKAILDSRYMLDMLARPDDSLMPESIYTPKSGFLSAFLASVTRLTGS